MKKSNIVRIAALRKTLESFAYTKDSVLAHAKDYLGNGLKFESNEIVNTRGHAAIMLTVYDENNDCREIIAEYCADKEEFTFNGIGLEENFYRCNTQLLDSISNASRINNKQAWIIPYSNEKIGHWNVLLSYNTVIAAWNLNSNIIYLQRNARNYSNTTRRHLSDFVKHVNRALKIKNETAVFKWACFE